MKVVLFERAFEKHWKRELGDLMGILNPSARFEKVQN
jgi:hypothetical protein